MIESVGSGSGATSSLCACRPLASSELADWFLQHGQLTDTMQSNGRLSVSFIHVEGKSREGQCPQWRWWFAPTPWNAVYLDARVRVARDTCSRSARAVIPL